MNFHPAKQTSSIFYIRLSLFISFIFVIPLLLSHLYAQEKFLSESEITDLSIKAFSGDKTALDNLVREYHRYDQKRTIQKFLTESENNLFNDIVETLQILSPKTLPAPKTEKNVIIKPDPKAPVEAKKESLEKPLLIDATKYFNLPEGTILKYTGLRKNFMTGQWSESGRSSKIHILNVEKIKAKAIETLAVNEISIRQGEWLAEQTLITFRMSQDGFQIQKDVVFSQPNPGTVAPIGKQDPYWIAKFPLKEGGIVEGYKILSLEAKEKTPLEEFKECLVISGQAERLVFAPSSGLVTMEVFDEKWVLSEIQNFPLAELPEIPRPYDDLLEDKIKQYCKRRDFKFDALLTLKNAGIPPSDVYHSRTLVYRNDKFDPDQKRFEVMEQKWIKKKNGKKILWELQ